MKNRIFKKIVALSLALLMLAGTGIGATLAGVDLLQSLSIKASAEDPKNSVHYDAGKGLFFTVDDAATIVGTDADAVRESCVDGVFTLPNFVTDTSDGHTYRVNRVNHFAFMNSRTDIVKIVIPNYFTNLSLTSAAFAGMDNLTEVELDYTDVVTEGPLFELVCNYKLDDEKKIEVTTGYNEDGTPKVQEVSAAVSNSFPLRNEYGVLQLNDDGTEATVRVYSKDLGNGTTEDYTDKTVSFTESISKLTNINTISKEDVDTWSYSASTDGFYEESAFIGNNTSSQITVYNKNNDTLPGGYLAFVFEEVSSFSADNIVDGNGALSKSSTIVLHKSPVASITLGEEVKTIPDYFFYDTDIKSVNLSNIEKIGKFAFVDCDGLTSVNLDNVTEIDEYAFAACDGLTEVTIPEGMKNLQNDAFTLCDNLSTVKYNAPACEISGTPFENSGVTTMIFGKDVAEIPANIGAKVSTLNNVIFLADTESLNINDGAFAGSGSISKVEVMEPEKWESVDKGSNNGSLAAKNTEVSNHNHAYIETVVPPTCAAEGYTVDICACGEEKEGSRRDNTAKLPHTFGDEPNSTVAASCESEGYDLYICKVCGTAEKKNVVAALRHDLQNVKTYPATCTEAGKTVGTCSRCKKEITTATTSALGHDFGGYKYNNDATEEKDGTETATCSRCGITVSRTVPGTKTSLSVTSSATVDYRTKLTVTAYGTNIPAGYRLAVFNGDKLLGTGDNNSVSYYAGEMTSDTNFLIRVIDSNNNILETAPKRVVKVTVNNGFFARIVAFFRGLFGTLPEKTI